MKMHIIINFNLRFLGLSPIKKDLKVHTHTHVSEQITNNKSHPGKVWLWDIQNMSRVYSEAIQCSHKLLLWEKISGY